MRMWGVEPSLLCQQHLLGEHVEMHMFQGTIRKGVSLRGYIQGGLVEAHLVRERHDQLALEMLRRNLNHRSPLPEFPAQAPAGNLDLEGNLQELSRRCAACRERIQRILPTIVGSASE